MEEDIAEMKKCQNEINVITEKINKRIDDMIVRDTYCTKMWKEILKF